MRNSSGNPQGGASFSTTPLGAGGYNCFIDIANDGGMVKNTDVGNAYAKLPSETMWRPLFTGTSLPNAKLTAASNSSYSNARLGCFAVANAPSNSNVIYMTYNGDWFRSTDSGFSFTLLGGPYVTKENGFRSRLYGPKSIVDPQNPNVAVLGTQEAKLIYTTNGTTVSVLTVAACANGPDGNPTSHLVAVDPTSSVVGGIKQKWAYSVHGTGILESTSGPGGPYSLLAGSPATPSCIRYDAAGNLWAVNVGEAGNIYKKPPAGSFAKVTSPSLECLTIAVDPSNTNIVVGIADNDCPTIVSRNGGATWLGNDVFRTTYPGGGAISYTATGIRWLAKGKGHGFFTAQAEFHPTNGRLYCAHGTGNAYCTPPTTFGPNTIQWIDDSLGDEMLNTRHVLALPGGRAPIYSVADKGFFRIADERRWMNLQSTGNPTVESFGHGWHCDYTPGDPDRLHGCCIYNVASHGYSTDAGKTWQGYAGSYPGGVNEATGGCIVAASANDLYWFPRNNHRAVESHDGGASWTYSNFPAGVPTSGSPLGWGNSMWSNDIVACSDKETGDVYCVNQVTSCVYKRAFGSASWVQVSTKFWSTNAEGNSALISVPGNAGHLLYVAGYSTPTPLYRSTNGGVTWNAVPNISGVTVASWGAAAPGKSNYSLFAVGSVASVNGLYRSDDLGASWVLLAKYPNNCTDAINSLAGDHLIHGKIHVGFANVGGTIGNYASTASGT